MLFRSARKLAASLTWELRNAVTGNTGAYALEQAGDQQIIFYSNVDKDSYIERVRYFISQGSLQRGVTKPSGNPLVYNSANETVKIVQNNLANGSNKLFYYYDGTYNGVSGSPITQPVNVSLVKYVKLDLRVFKKAGVVNTNYYSVTSGAAIRSLKSNLGN